MPVKSPTKISKNAGLSIFAFNQVGDLEYSMILISNHFSN